MEKPYAPHVTLKSHKTPLNGMLQDHELMFGKLVLASATGLKWVPAAAGP